MKDGRTHLAYKPEHAVDLDTGAIVSADIHKADQGDTTTIGKTLESARKNLSDVGCTPITTPGPRWSDYVFKLRRRGIDVETVTESHGGPYAGTHARYVLRSKIERLSVDSPRVAASVEQQERYATP